MSLSQFFLLWAVVGCLTAWVMARKAASAASSLGFEMEEHPIAWIPFILACLLVGPPFLLVQVTLVPLIGLVSGLGFLSWARAGERVRISEEGLEIYNRARTVERQIPWEEIERAEMVFEAPFNLPHLYLRDGERLRLSFAPVDELAEALAERGVPFPREAVDGTGIETEKDGE